jgi:hypothetical protein
MDAFQFIKDVAVDWDESKYIETESFFSCAMFLQKNNTKKNTTYLLKMFIKIIFIQIETAKLLFFI